MGAGGSADQGQDGQLDGTLHGLLVVDRVVLRGWLMACYYDFWILSHRSGGCARSNCFSHTIGLAV